MLYIYVFVNRVVKQSIGRMWRCNTALSVPIAAGDEKPCAHLLWEKWMQVTQFINICLYINFNPKQYHHSIRFLVFVFFSPGCQHEHSQSPCLTVVVPEIDCHFVVTAGTVVISDIVLWPAVTELGFCLISCCLFMACFKNILSLDEKFCEKPGCLLPRWCIFFWLRRLSCLRATVMQWDLG